MSKNNEDGIYTFDIDKFYKSYLNGPRIFKNREALEPSFVPDELPHRDKEIERIAGLTACALRSTTLFYQASLVDLYKLQCCFHAL
ncbi:MAG: hypothetical protein ACTSSM_12330 [Promethearchaeota archaeon]